MMMMMMMMMILVLLLLLLLLNLRRSYFGFWRLGCALVHREEIGLRGNERANEQTANEHNPSLANRTVTTAKIAAHANNDTKQQTQVYRRAVASVEKYFACKLRTVSQNKAPKVEYQRANRRSVAKGSIAMYRRSFV